MTNLVVPRYQHDCDKCQFIGIDVEYDIYFCKNCDGGTWIARYGDDGYEYASYPMFVLDTITERGGDKSSSIIAITKMRSQLKRLGTIDI